MGGEECAHRFVRGAFIKTRLGHAGEQTLGQRGIWIEASDFASLAPDH